MFSWVLTIPFAAFLIDLGKFIDDFHPPNGHSVFREKIRHALIWCFEKLERISIPYVSLRVLRIIFAVRYRITIKLFLLLSISYFAIMLCVWKTALTMYFNGSNTVSLGFSAINVVFYSVVCLPSGRFAVKVLDRQSPFVQRVLTPSIILVMTFLPFIVFVLLVNLYNAVRFGRIHPFAFEFQKHGYNSLSPSANGLLLLSGSSIMLEPNLLILVIIGFVGIIMGIILFLKVLTTIVFRRASDPRKSPLLTYSVFCGIIVTHKGGTWIDADPGNLTSHRVA